MNWKQLAKDRRAQGAIVAIVVALFGIAGVQCNPEQQKVLLDAIGAVADSAVTDTTE